MQDAGEVGRAQVAEAGQQRLGALLRAHGHQPDDVEPVEHPGRPAAPEPRRCPRGPRAWPAASRRCGSARSPTSTTVPCTDAVLGRDLPVEQLAQDERLAGSLLEALDVEQAGGDHPAGVDRGDAGDRQEDPAAAGHLRDHADHPRRAIGPHDHDDVAHPADLVAVRVEHGGPGQAGDEHPRQPSTHGRRVAPREAAAAGALAADQRAVAAEARRACTAAVRASWPWSREVVRRATPATGPRRCRSTCPVGVICTTALSRAQRSIIAAPPSALSRLAASAARGGGPGRRLPIATARPARPRSRPARGCPCSARSTVTSVASASPGRSCSSPPVTTYAAPSTQTCQAGRGDVLPAGSPYASHTSPALRLASPTSARRAPTCGPRRARRLLALVPRRPAWHSGATALLAQWPGGGRRSSGGVRSAARLRADALLMTVGVLAVATSGPIMAATVAPALAIAFWRNALGAAATAPIMALRRRAELRAMSRRQWQLTIGAGVLLAAHFAAWVPEPDVDERGVGHRAGLPAAGVDGVDRALARVRGDRPGVAGHRDLRRRCGAAHRAGPVGLRRRAARRRARAGRRHVRCRVRRARRGGPQEPRHHDVHDALLLDGGKRAARGVPRSRARRWSATTRGRGGCWSRSLSGRSCSGTRCSTACCAR